MEGCCSKRRINAICITLPRGFSSRQYAIDQKLAKMGLGESSTAFGVQVALAREKANAYSDLELKQAELAQGLKQQSLANLHQRGDLISKNANVELNKFAAESQNKLANEQLIQHQAIAEKELEFKSEEQRLSTEFANRNMLDQRRANMASLGVNAMTNNNQQAISAQGIDNSAIAGQNAAQYQRHSLIRNPWREAANMGIGILGGKAAGALGDKMFGGETNPWSNPDSSNPSAGTMGWSKNSTKLVGNKWS